MAIGDYGTLYVISFALISITATIGERELRRELGFYSARKGCPVEEDPIVDTVSFVVRKATSLVQLMFSALSGRYIVSLFQSSRHHSGYVLAVVVAAVILIRRASQSTRPKCEAQ